MVVLECYTLVALKQLQQILRLELCGKVVDLDDVGQLIVSQVSLIFLISVGVEVVEAGFLDGFLLLAFFFGELQE